MAEVAETKGDINEAVRRYGESLQIVRSFGARYAETAGEIGWGFLELKRFRFREARRRLKNAETIARDMGYEYLLDNALQFLARLAIHEDRLDDAERIIEELLARVTKRQNSLGMCSALHELGLVVRKRADLIKAFEYNQRALGIAEEEHSVRQEGIVSNALGNIFLRTAQIALAVGTKKDAEQAVTESRRYLERSLATGRGLPDVRMEGTQLTLLGILAFWLGETDLAESLLLQGYMLASRAENMDDIGIALKTLGDIASGRGQRTDAICFLWQSLAPLRLAHRYDLAHEAISCIRKIAGTWRLELIVGR